MTENAIALVNNRSRSRRTRAAIKPSNHRGGRYRVRIHEDDDDEEDEGEEEEDDEEDDDEGDEKDILEDEDQDHGIIMEENENKGNSTPLRSPISSHRQRNSPSTNHNYSSRGYNSKDLPSLEQHAVVRIIKTPDVEQRVPHTINCIGVIADVPQHPNTWFKVRLRDGEGVYKYRPSALQLISRPRTNGNKYEDHKMYEVDHSDDDLEEKEEDLMKGNVSDGGRDRHREEIWEPNTRVLITLKNLSRWSKDMKKHQGKEGVILDHGVNGYRIQLDDDERSIIRLKERHLRLLSNLDDNIDLEREDEDEHRDDDDNDASDSHHEGDLLSTIDPEMWIDRKCRINVGKFKGLHGVVLRSGNGWVQLKLANSSENTAKRAYELTLLEDKETIEKLYAESLAKGGNRPGDATDDGAADDEDDGGDEIDDLDESHSGQKTDGTDSQSEDKLGRHHPQSRVRRSSVRGSYGVSWIEKKVLLPKNKGTGIVKRADRDTCTVEISNKGVMRLFRKKDLVLLEDEPTQRAQQQPRRHRKEFPSLSSLEEGMKLMGTTPSRYAAFQDQIKRFAMRRREKIKKRPNLQSWLVETQLVGRSNGLEEVTNPHIKDMLIVPCCIICGVEMEVVGGSCWNASCPRSMSFQLKDFEPSDKCIARCPTVPIKSQLIATTLCKTVPTVISSIELPNLQNPDSVRKRKRKTKLSADKNQERDGILHVKNDDEMLLKLKVPKQKHSDSPSQMAIDVSQAVDSNVTDDPIIESSRESKQLSSLNDKSNYSDISVNEVAAMGSQNPTDKTNVHPKSIVDNVDSRNQHDLSSRVALDTGVNSNELSNADEGKLNSNYKTDLEVSIGREN